MPLYSALAECVLRLGERAGGSVPFVRKVSLTVRRPNLSFADVSSWPGPTFRRYTRKPTFALHGRPLPGRTRVVGQQRSSPAGCSPVTRPAGLGGRTTSQARDAEREFGGIGIQLRGRTTKRRRIAKKPIRDAATSLTRNR
jgi:hypothetical protein